MQTIESAVNLALMSTEHGREYIYKLANNNDLTEIEQINTLKNDTMGLCLDYIYEAEIDHSDRFVDKNNELQFVFNDDFFSIVFSSILRSTDWSVILDYHKE